MTAPADAPREAGRERDEHGSFVTFRAYAEHYAGERGFYGPLGTFIRMGAAADSMIAEQRAALLRYARHDRECPYPDHDCSCGLAAVITPILAALSPERGTPDQERA